MTVTHRLQIEGTCPVDGTHDVYDCVITLRRVIAVERILAAVHSATAVDRFQEDITAMIARDLRADVTTIGIHSGVTTTCRCVG